MSQVKITIAFYESGKNLIRPFSTIHFLKIRKNVLMSQHLHFICGLNLENLI